MGGSQLGGSLALQSLRNSSAVVRSRLEWGRTAGGEWSSGRRRRPSADPEPTPAASEDDEVHSHTRTRPRGLQAVSVGGRGLAALPKLPVDSHSRPHRHFFSSIILGAVGSLGFVFLV